MMRMNGTLVAVLAMSLTVGGCADSPVTTRTGIVTFTTQGMAAADGQRIFRTVTRVPSNAPLGLSLRPDGIGLATHPGFNSLSIVDAVNQSVVGTIPVGACPQSTAFSPDGKTAYVAHSCEMTVGVVDMVTRAMVSRIPLGREVATHLAMSADGASLYVGTVSSAVLIVSTQTQQVVDLLRWQAVGSIAGIVLDRTGTALYASTTGPWVIEFDLLTRSSRRQLLLGGATEGMTLSEAGDHLIVANDGGYFSDVILATGFFLNTWLATATYDAAHVAPMRKTILTLPRGSLVSYDEVNHVVRDSLVVGGTPRRVRVHLPSRTAVVTDQAGFILFIR